jgi:hypothetical protein
MGAALTTPLVLVIFPRIYHQGRLGAAGTQNTAKPFWQNQVQLPIKMTYQSLVCIGNGNVKIRHGHRNGAIKLINRCHT